uniref:vacuolar protein sorting-associated protein 72 homolog n=1 Tax=Styela clava TaxID=7725 RepID=UPI00193A776E|nr:vacuolar protein sorting-associated protein 72 homolog [Styela clava]
MAAAREPRCTAGNRMSKVMEEELDDDDFYKTTYGGFEEEKEDNDFESDQEDSADEVDSDFDISENDEIVSDQDEETIKQSEKKRKRGANTKAYKDPSIKKAKKDEKEISKSDDNKEEKVPKEAKKTEPTAVNNDGPSRKSSRRATAANSYLISMKVKERKIADQKKKETVKKPMAGVRRLTQEELMQEAERTERKNLKSLHNYQRLEANRKKSSTKKRTFAEPTIKYLSTTMPSVDPDEPSKISRDFIIFSEPEVFKNEFHWKKQPRINKPICPVTNKPARYIDPLTNIPYYDMDAFKLIREAHTLSLAKRDKVK